MKKLLALSTIFISTLSAAQAYEIGTVCKEATQGWVRRVGTCDNDGFLQGRGVASIGDLVVFGDFTRGLPNGLHHLIFVANVKQLEKGNVEYFIPEKLRAISKLNGPFYDRPVDICKMNFSNGQPADNILNCSGVEAKAKFGKVRMNQANGLVTLSMDEADIKGIHSKGRATEFALDNGQSMSIEGSALKVAFGGLTNRPGSRDKIYDFYITGLNGIAALQPKENENRKTADFVKGVFDFSGFTGSRDGGTEGIVILRKIEHSVKPAAEASRDMRYDFSVYGNKFRAAYYGGGELIASYLKVENGVEFDGSGFELCINSPWVNHRDSQPNVAGAVVLSFKEGRGSDSNKYLNILPRCGKITDQTGRSYSGFFDKDGKPSPR